MLGWNINQIIHSTNHGYNYWCIVDATENDGQLDFKIYKFLYSWVLNNDHLLIIATPSFRTEKHSLLQKKSTLKISNRYPVQLPFYWKVMLLNSALHFYQNRHWNYLTFFRKFCTYFRKECWFRTLFFLQSVISSILSIVDELTIKSNSNFHILILQSRH